MSTCPAPESPPLLCSRLSSAASLSPRSRPILSSLSLPSWFLKSLQTSFHCGFVGQLWDNFKRTWGQLWDIWDNCWTTLRHLWDYIVTITSALSIWPISNLDLPFLLLPVMTRYNVFQPTSAMILSIFYWSIFRDLLPNVHLVSATPQDEGVLRPMVEKATVRMTKLISYLMYHNICFSRSKILPAFGKQ